MDACRNNSGFTLVEMLITVAIIVILTAMLIGAGTALDRQAKRQGTKNLIAQLEAAIDLYYDFKGVYPSMAGRAGVDAAMNSEQLYYDLCSVAGSRKIVEKISPKLIRDEYPGPINGPEIYDAWGRPIDYRYYPSYSYPELKSAGPDKFFGTSDDITNKKP